MTNEAKEVQARKKAMDFEKEVPCCKNCTFFSLTTNPDPEAKHRMMWCLEGKFRTGYFSVCNSWIDKKTGATLED